MSQSYSTLSAAITLSRGASYLLGQLVVAKGDPLLTGCLQRLQTESAIINTKSFRLKRAIRQMDEGNPLPHGSVN
jgi:hypothetical protein